MMNPTRAALEGKSWFILLIIRLILGAGLVYIAASIWHYTLPQVEWIMPAARWITGFLLIVTFFQAIMLYILTRRIKK